MSGNEGERFPERFPDQILAFGTGWMIIDDTISELGNTEKGLRMRQMVPWRAGGGL